MTQNLFPSLCSSVPLSRFSKQNDHCSGVPEQWGCQGRTQQHGCEGRLYRLQKTTQSVGDGVKVTNPEGETYPPVQLQEEEVCEDWQDTLPELLGVK